MFLLNRVVDVYYISRSCDTELNLTSADKHQKQNTNACYLFINKYSRISMARTLMAHSPWLARTIITVPSGHLMHAPSCMAGTDLG